MRSSGERVYCKVGARRQEERREEAADPPPPIDNCEPGKTQEARNAAAALYIAGRPLERPPLLPGDEGRSIRQRATAPFHCADSDYSRIPVAVIAEHPYRENGRTNTSWQMSLSSFSTFSRYSLAICCFFSEPSVFCSIEEITRHDDRRAPTTFLYATDRRFRSCKHTNTTHI